MHLRASPDPVDTESESSGLDLLAIYHSFLERKWIVLGCLAATLLLGLLYILKTPKTYEAETVVQVEQAANKVVLIQDVTTEDLKQTEILNTIQTNLVSAPVLAGVINALKLDFNALGLSPRDPPYSQAELITQLETQITAEVQRGTRLIRIAAQNTDPAIAKKEAEELVNQYIRVDLEQRANISGSASRFLADESARLKIQLDLAEKEVQAFKDQHPDVGLEDSAQYIDNKLLALTTKLNEARSNTFKLSSDYAQVQTILGAQLSDPAKAQQLIRISGVSEDANVLQLEKTIAEQEGELAKLKQRYTPLHPKYIEMQSQLAGLRSALDRAVLKASETVGAALDAAKHTEANFQGLVQEAERAKVAFDRIAIPFGAYTREAESYRSLYMAVQMRMKETAITQEVKSNDIRVVTPALMPDKPVKPQKLLVMVASVFGGLLLGFCVSFALSATDNSFKTVDQVEQTLGLRALAVVPNAGKVIPGQGLLILREPQGAVAEAIRTLRASLAMRQERSEHTRFLFTSAVPGEGKTFCSTNFAVSLAQLGLRTLLIDADLRLPAVSREFFPKDSSGGGVTSVLQGDATLKEAVQSTDTENLFVLTAGERVRNPAELLSTANFGELLREALLTYERIVIDSAPVHAVSDTMLLVRYVESVCLVVQAGKTPQRAVKRAVEALTEVDARPAGIILNRASQHHGAGYYYYYSAGKYGEGVYGASADTAAS